MLVLQGCAVHSMGMASGCSPFSGVHLYPSLAPVN